MLQFLGRLLVYYIMATVALSFLGRFSKRARFISRVLSCYLLLMSCAAYGVLASVALRLVGRVGLAQWATARAFKAVTQPVTGIKFVVEGEEILEKTKPAVFMSNHQTELDIIMLGKVFPKNCSVTAKRSLKYIPFLGWFMSLSGAVFIDRANRDSAISAFDAAVRDMKTRQQSVFIFPEGTRSYFSKPDLLPFKKGAFHLAVQAGVPIVPIVVGNYAHVLHVQSMTFDSGDVKVKVLDPIPTTGLTAADVDGLSKKVRELMLKEIKAIGGGVEESSKSK